MEKNIGDRDTWDHIEDQALDWRTQLLPLVARIRR
jgi:hypothetical protein